MRFNGGLDITKDSLNILMEGTPEDLDVEELKERFLSVNGIKEISDFKVWCIAHEEQYLNLHITIEDSIHESVVLSEIKNISKEYQLRETVQINN